MSNILLEYMKKRFNTESPSLIKSKNRIGPIVTISREYGCPAKRLAGMLTSSLNRIELENFSREHWKWIGKEVLDESARELNLKPEMVRDVVNTQEKGLVDEIILSLSHKSYPGDKKIKNTLGEVIRSFAEQGHVVIVGRGGVSITRDIPNSLHIKIMAPLEWRINDVSKRQMITLAEAEKKIRELDHQRLLIRGHFEKTKIDDSTFDVILNYMTLAEEDMIATIVKMMELKDLL